MKEAISWLGGCNLKKAKKNAESGDRKVKILTLGEAKEGKSGAEKSRGEAIVGESPETIFL